MTKFLIGVAVLALSATSANAVIIQIDDFDTDQGPIADGTTDGVPVTAPTVTYSVGGNSFDRDLSINLLSALPPEESEAEVVDGVLDISNGVGDDSTTVVTYDVSSLVDDVAALGPILDLAFLFEVIQSDANPITIGAVLNGVDLGVFNLPANVTNEILSFAIPDESLVGGDLVLTINGAPGYDLALEALGLEVNQDVPAPAMLGLFGLGLAGIGLARRRR